VEVPPFQTFLEAHRGAVYRFLVGLVGPQDAEDCFQETFLAALRAYPRADGRNLRAWALTIAHRKAMDAHRGRRRRPVPVERVPDAPAPDAPLSDPGLWRDVVALPEGQRAAILLRYVEDLPYRDIGAVLGCTEAAARQRVREGLRALREVVTT
jgi:DNA-directed RNA polymerase specialized sigma24 family protein